MGTFFDPAIRKVVSTDTVEAATIAVAVVRNSAGDTKRIVVTYPNGSTETTNFTYTTEA